jgi:hypothetical protein
VQAAGGGSGGGGSGSGAERTDRQWTQGDVHEVPEVQGSEEVNSDAKVANRNARDFGWEVAHGAVSRRPPISLYTTVARTHMYTYDAKLCDVSIVQ